MRTKKEGYNTFSKFDTINIAIDYPSRHKKINSFQIIFGGHASFDPEQVKTHNRKYRHDLKKFFYEKSKDGYYKDKFLFIDGTPDCLKSKSSGLIFHEVFFFLEEQCEKEFLISYLLPIFQELNYYHKNHPNIKFKKYIKDKSLRDV